LFLSWSFLFLLIFPLELLTPQTIQLSPNVIQIQFPIFQVPLCHIIAILISVLVLFIPVHEMVHALCCPAWGLSADTVFSIWFSKGFIYIHHDSPMSRNRFLFVLVAPYIILSLLPLALMAIFGITNWPPELILALTWLSLLGSLLAGGDFVSIGSLLSSKIPGSAFIRNIGQKSYWKSIDKTS